MLAAIRRFLRDDGGPTAVEYAVLIALIVLGAVAAIKAFGDGSSGLWARDVDQISSALAPGQ